MSDEPAEFQALLERVRAGCPEAAQEIHHRYNEALRRVVRRRLHHPLRTQYDSVDFLQGVWASFFQMSPERHHFDTPDDLVAFLSRVAINKVVETLRYQHTAKRNIHRQQPLKPRDSEGAVEVPGRDPSASQLAIAEERWERLLEGQPPQYRRVLELLRAGHTHQEVAAQLGLHPKVIQRLLQKLTSSRERA
jgi:RNA polymerase sigma-70 factor (ECF subfamily)